MPYRSRPNAKPRRLTAVVLTLALAILPVIGAAAPADAADVVDPQPWKIRIARFNEVSSFPAALVVSFLDPRRSPPGANDWTCQPSPEHPEPVVLIHGTLENSFDNFAGLSPILKDQGYCVFTTTYGATSSWPFLGGVGDRKASAMELAPFIERVRTTTGAESVALIGHSQGGAQARYYANFLAPFGTVNKVIGIAPANHVTSFGNFMKLVNALRVTPLARMVYNLARMPAVLDQTDPDSPFDHELNDYGETVPDIAYTNIATRGDQIVTPYTQAFVTADFGAMVNNIVIQDVCPRDRSDHLSLSYSKNVAQLILNALDPEHPHAIHCYQQSPMTGSTGQFG